MLDHIARLPNLVCCDSDLITKERNSQSKMAIVRLVMILAFVSSSAAFLPFGSISLLPNARLGTRANVNAFMCTAGSNDESLSEARPLDGQSAVRSSIISDIGAQAASRRTVRVSVSPAEMAEMAAMAAAASPDMAQNRKQKLAMAVASPLLAAALFFGGRMMPSDPVTLLRAMESQSPKLEVALASGRPVLVEFYAQWCGDCKTMAKSMVELERTYGRASDRSVNFVVLDAERPENADLVNKFRVDAIPHFAFISQDKVIKTTITGYLPKGVMQKQLDAFAAGEQLPFCGPDLCGLDPNSNEYYLQAGSRL